MAHQGIPEIIVGRYSPTRAIVASCNRDISWQPSSYTDRRHKLIQADDPLARTLFSGINIHNIDWIW